MARILCQVLQRANRLTLIWSEGGAAFEPYHLEAPERSHLFDLAAQIHVKLGHSDGLAQLGHKLYRAVFRQDATDYGSAEQVRQWLEKLVSSNAIERIEFLSDVPGAVPWNALMEDASAGFWGDRFSIGAGRRVNALRQNPTQEKPTLVFALDSTLVSSEDVLAPVRAAGRLLSTGAALAEEVRKHVPDILVLLCRFEHGQLRLGADSISVVDLQKWLDEPKVGNPDPLVVLMASGDAVDQSAWLATLAGASAAFSGLVAPETLLPGATAFEVGHAIAQRFADGKQSLGEVLRSLRQEKPAARAFSAFCPPQLRVMAEGAAVAPEPETQVEVAPLPRYPYRPFAAFDADDRALFFGREDDAVHGALAIDHADALAVVMHGAPSVGKTSHLQAGLLPYLEQECVGFRVLRDRGPGDPATAEKDYPIIVLRCTNDLAGQFADALAAFCAQPLIYVTPAGTEVRVDLPGILQQAISGAAATLTTAIQAAPSATAPAGDDDDGPTGASVRDVWVALRDHKDLLGKILDAVTRSLPFELVIAIDQGEELLTQVTTEQQRLRRQKALDMLVHLSHAAPRCKIIYTIRTQELGQFASLFPDGRLPANWRPFYLRPLTDSEMVDALLWPTNREEIPYCGEVPHQKYGFAFEDGMAGQIVADAVDTAAAEQQGPLPIVQAVGALLYERQVVEKKQDVLRAGDIKDAGGVKDALTKYLDRTLDRLPITQSARLALRSLITKLYTSHADGTLSRDLVPASEVPTLWDSPAEPADVALNQAAQEQGLFDIQELFVGGQDEVFVSLPQDSLAQLGKKLVLDREKQAAGRSKVIDVLWVMIPLTFLVAAVTFWATRQYGAGQSDRDAIRKEVIDDIRERVEQIMEEKDGTLRSAQRLMYYGNIAQADVALRASNIPTAREILLGQILVYGKKKDPKMSDMRGFDWKHLWRTINNERFLLEGHRAPVTALAVSTDGKRAVSADNDGEIRIWNLQTGKSMASISLERTPVLAVALAPDGKSLAAGGDDKTVRVWDLSELKDTTGEITAKPKLFEGHTDKVHAIAFGKDATELASASADKSVIVWDIAAGKARHTLKEHTAAVKAIAFTDAKSLVSAGDEARLIAWDTGAGKKRDAKETPFRSITALAVSADGKTLGVAGVEAKFDASLGSVRLFDANSLKESQTILQTGAIERSIAFDPEGKTILTGGVDQIVRTWDAKTGKQTQQWIGHIAAINGVAYAKDAIVSASADGSVKVWDPNQSTGVDVIAAHADAVQVLALSSDKTLLASGARDGSVKLWDPKTNKLIKELPAFKGAVTALAISSSRGRALGKEKSQEDYFLAAGTRTDKNEGEIKIWQLSRDAKQGWQAKDHLALKDQTKGVTCLAFHPSEDRVDTLVSGSTDHTVRVWDAKAGKLVKTHAGHKDEVRCLAFGFDGRTFYSGGRDAQVCVYELDSNDIRKLADMHRASVEAIAAFEIRVVSEEDDIPHSITGLITGGADHVIRTWHYDQHSRVASALELKKAFYAHAQPVSALIHNRASASDIFSAGWDGAIVIGDRNFERLTLTGHQGPVRALALAYDQSFLVSAGNDGTIRIWRTPAEPAADKK